MPKFHDEQAAGEAELLVHFRRAKQSMILHKPQTNPPIISAPSGSVAQSEECTTN